MKKFLKGLFFFIITILVLTGIVVTIFVFSPSARNAYNKMYRNAVGWYEEPLLVEYTLDSIDSIDISAVSNDVHIQVSEDANEITISYYSNWDGNFIESCSSSFSLKETLRTSWLYFFLPKIDSLVYKDTYKPIEITLPSYASLTKIKASSTSGAVTVKGAKADNAELETVNKDISVIDCDFGKATLSNASGGVTVKGSELGDGSKIEHSSGSINISESVIGNDSKISGSSNITDSVLGDGTKLTSTNGKINVIRGEFKGLEISSTSGNVTVENIKNIALCKLDLSAGAGKIKVSGVTSEGSYKVSPVGYISWLKINLPSGNITIS